MTDARYPEAWLNDRRIVRLSDAGHRLFTTANAWSASNRTDGHLEAPDLALIHGVDGRHATELTDAGLWSEVSGGWQIVDFHKAQSTKAQLDGLDYKRHQDRERQARKRARDRGDLDPDPPDLEPVSRDVTPVTNDVTSTVTQRQGRTGRQGAVTGSTTEKNGALDNDLDAPFLPQRSA